MKIDPSHPRYHSLKYREQLVQGVRMGITSIAGLIAHGRGEAFDYLLAEKTHGFAKKSIEAAAVCLLLSRKPVLSINGNTAMLVPRELARLADLLSCPIEINLFHYSVKRARIIESYMKKFSGRVLSTSSRKVRLPHIASARNMTLQNGIADSDCVFVPLEDGDRAQALVKMGKQVITVDLNPLSRTARRATVTIVDNIIRTMPQLLCQVDMLRKSDKKKLLHMINTYNNPRVLSQAIKTIHQKLVRLAIL